MLAFPMDLDYISNLNHDTSCYYQYDFDTSLYPKNHKTVMNHVKANPGKWAGVAVPWRRRQEAGTIALAVAATGKIPAGVEHVLVAWPSKDGKNKSYPGIFDADIFWVYDANEIFSESCPIKPSDFETGGWYDRSSVCRYQGAIDTPELNTLLRYEATKEAFDVLHRTFSMPVQAWEADWHDVVRELSFGYLEAPEDVLPTDPWVKAFSNKLAFSTRLWRDKPDEFLSKLVEFDKLWNRAICGDTMVIGHIRKMNTTTIEILKMLMEEDGIDSMIAALGNGVPYDDIVA